MDNKTHKIISPEALLGVSALHKDRNEVICNILEYCRYMESKGSGFDKIEHDYAGKGEAFKPFISADGNSFALVLPDLTFAYGVIDEDSIVEVHVGGILDEKK